MEKVLKFGQHKQWIFEVRTYINSFRLHKCINGGVNWIFWMRMVGISLGDYFDYVDWGGFKGYKSI